MLHRIQQGSGELEKASAAHLVPVGVGYLEPERAVFDAMVEGWRVQQVSRGLKGTTISTRLALVRRMWEFTNDYPWNWTPADGEAFIAGMLDAPAPRAHSTIRNYENQLRQFMSYLLDARYQWAAECLRRFNVVPQQVFHEDNSIAHTVDFEGRPGRRALTVDEIQELFAAAEDLVERSLRSKRKGRLAAIRAAAMLKVVYAFGLRRRECAMLDLPDLSRNPRVPDYGRFGALQVRWGKAARGSAPKRRTVLLVPEMDWVVPVLEHWIDEARPVLVPQGVRLPQLWPTERGNRIVVQRLDDVFESVRAHAGLPDEGLDLHSLRHSYVTHLLEFGYPELFVQKQVGHSYAATTSLYSHVSDGFRNQLMASSLERQMNTTALAAKALT